MASNSEFQPIVVSTTSDQRDILETIANQLVESKLAACVQISGPVTSCFHWQGAVENSTEWLCLIKTSKHRYKDVETSIKNLHNYDDPQIIAVEICEGSNTYLNWMAQALS